MMCQLICSAIGSLKRSVATYILDRSVLVDLALQVLEDALSEKSVCRHDVRFAVCLS
jgi:hypothetical protein